MSQLRFIGFSSDITQEVLLMMSRSLSRPGILSGLNLTIEDTLQSSLNLVLAPGTFILPDGMIVQESTEVRIPLIRPDQASSSEMTVIAYRISETGYRNDEVRYKIVQGKQYQATLTQVSNIVQMPIAWIKKRSGGNAANYFDVIDLGYRSSILQERFSAPIVNLVSAVSPQNQVVLFEMDQLTVNGVVVNRLLQNLQPNVTYWLRIPERPNHVISDFVISGKSGSFNLKSLSVASTYADAMNLSLAFDSAAGDPLIVTYPVRARIASDILQLTPSALTQISEIVVNWARIF
jgi:hypothetical protein